MSADPLALHNAWQNDEAGRSHLRLAELPLYAFVSGSPLLKVDVLGLQEMVNDQGNALWRFVKGAVRGVGAALADGGEGLANTIPAGDTPDPSVKPADWTPLKPDVPMSDAGQYGFSAGYAAGMVGGVGAALKWMVGKARPPTTVTTKAGGQSVPGRSTAESASGPKTKVQVTAEEVQEALDATRTNEVRVYHKGEMNDSRPTFSTGLDEESVAALDRPGTVHEFRVPKEVLDEWIDSGQAERMRDYDEVTGVVNEEIRFKGEAAEKVKDYEVK